MVFVFLDENGEIIKEYFNKDNNLPLVESDNSEFIYFPT
jgi:hypothetical protein